MTRLLMTADAVRDEWPCALELAAALAGHGVETVLAVLGPEPDERRRRWARRVPGLRLEHAGLPLAGAGPGDPRRAAGEWLLELAVRHPPDLVHVHGADFAALPWRRPVVCAVDRDLLSWWRAVHPGSEPAGWRRHRERVGRALAAADAVVTPSLHLLRELLRDYGPVMSLAAIPPGRSRPGRPTPPDSAREPLILGAGRLWDEGDNLGALAAVAPGVPWPVAVAGPSQPPGGGPEARLPGIDVLGDLAGGDLAAWMERAAVFAQPARYPPAGLAALDAALAGCALVLGDEPGQREMWDGAAVFVPPDDADALAAALRHCADDPAHRRSLARAAGRRAAEYTPERWALAHLHLYREVGRRRRRLAPRQPWMRVPAPAPAIEAWA